MSYEANDLLVKLTPNSLTYFILAFGLICCVLLILYININPISQPLVVINGKPNVVFYILSYIIKFSYVFAFLLLIYYLNSYSKLVTSGFLIGFDGLLVDYFEISGDIYKYFFYRNTPILSIGVFIILREVLINDYFEVRRKKQNIVILQIISFYLFFMLIGELEGFFGYVRVGYGEKVLSYINVTAYYVKFVINVIGFFSSVLLHILYNNKDNVEFHKSSKSCFLRKHGIFNILFICIFLISIMRIIYDIYDCSFYIHL